MLGLCLQKTAMFQTQLNNKINIENWKNFQEPGDKAIDILGRISQFEPQQEDQCESKGQRAKTIQ